MLNARIEIETDKNPYRVYRKMPSMLQNYFKEQDDWIEFCERLDRVLAPYEEIKAAWMIIGVIFTLLFLGLIAGVMCRYFLVDDEDLGLIISASLFGATFVVFTFYFFLMQLLVVKPLDIFSKKVNIFCGKTASKWENVEFHFERNESWSVYWDSNLKAWINVTVSDPVDLNT